MKQHGTQLKMCMQKDKSYETEYRTYGYGYAKALVDKGDIKNGMEIYNSVSQYTRVREQLKCL